MSRYLGRSLQSHLSRAFLPWCHGSCDLGIKLLFWSHTTWFGHLWRHWNDWSLRTVLLIPTADLLGRRAKLDALKKPGYGGIKQVFSSNRPFFRWKLPHKILIQSCTQNCEVLSVLSNTSITSILSIPTRNRMLLCGPAPQGSSVPNPPQPVRSAFDDLHLLPLRESGLSAAYLWKKGPHCCSMTRLDVTRSV